MLLEFLSSAGGGGIAGAGLSLLGGMFGQSAADKRNQEQMRMAQAQFDAQMDQTIQRRVKDAQKAGIHPLFALGSSAGSSPTLSAGGDPSQAGAPMANALGKAGGMLAQAAIAKTHAEAQLAAAQAAQVRQTMDSEGRDIPAIQDALGRTVTPFGDETARMVNVRPVDVPAQQSAGVRAGQEPSMIPVTLPGGRVVNAPNPDIFEEPWSPATLGALSQAVLGLTDQEIFQMAKWLGGKVSYHLRKAGLSDQQIFAKLKAAKEAAKKGLVKGRNYNYSRNY